MLSIRKAIRILPLCFLGLLWNCTTTSNLDSEGQESVDGSTGTTATDGAYGENASAFLNVEKIHFDFDKNVIKSEFESDLVAVADYLKANPTANLHINGHCDERGTTEYNIALGHRRAEAVKKYLVALGVEGERLTTHSFGKEMLIDNSGTEAGHYANRRAEFVPKTENKEEEFSF